MFVCPKDALIHGLAVPARIPNYIIPSGTVGSAAVTGPDRQLPTQSWSRKSESRGNIGGYPDGGTTTLSYILPYSQNRQNRQNRQNDRFARNDRFVTFVAFARFSRVQEAQNCL